VDDGEIPASPMDRMRPPHVPEQPVPVLAEAELAALLAAAKGNTFENRRDTAILRLLIDTGCRLGELAGLQLAGVDQDQEVAHWTGTRRRGRALSYGAKPADPPRRYLRARNRHPRAHLPALWLGKKGPMTASGIYQMLQRRAVDAGVPGV